MDLKFSFHGEEYNMKNTLIISAYTCCGKTYASEHMKNYDILDVDVSKFKTIKRLPNEEEIEKEHQRWESSLHLMSVEGHLNQFKQQIIKVDNPDFPDNFIQYIKENIGKVDVIFVDSDIRIRQWLDKAKIKFITIYPLNNCLPEWVGRMYLHDYPDIIIRNEKRMLQEAVDALINNGRRGRTSILLRGIHQ